jgi:plastocyanin
MPAVLAVLMLMLLPACSQEITTGEDTVVPPPANESSGTPDSGAEQPDSEIPPSEEGNLPNRSAAQTHVVNLIDGGFEDLKITIKVGEAVAWQNVRENAPAKALLLGTQKCSKLKSPFFNPGEMYKYTFTEPMTCIVADGIFTTQTMKVIVE